MKTRTPASKKPDTAPLFPPVSDREAWLAVRRKPRSRKMAREIIRIAREVLNQPIAPLPASLFMEFIRSGNRSHYETNYFSRRGSLNALAVAESLENNGEFLEGIVNYLWEITAEHTWCVPAHCGMAADPLPEPPAEIVDLFAAETGMTLSSVLNLLEPDLKEISPNLVRTVRENLLRRVVEPILRKPFPFHWLDGRNNWTPWVCSNCLCTVFCVLKDEPEKLEKAVAVLQEGIDKYIRLYPADGGCTEGPTYWGRSPGMLLFFMEQIRNWSGSPKIRPMAEYILNACITPDYYADFGDCPPRTGIPAGAAACRTVKNGSMQIYSWHPFSPWICCRFGERIGCDALVSMGLLAARDYPAHALLRDLFSTLAFFFWIPARRASAIRKKPVVFYPESQILFLNEGETALAAKRGHACNHHHCDVGQVILFHRNRPVLVDLGSVEYRRATFGPDRWKDWHLNAEGHNIPQFNGSLQWNKTAAEPNSMTVFESKDAVVCSMDLTTAYPPEAGVWSCIRELTWDRKGKTMEIHDSWKLKKRSGNLVRIPFYTPESVFRHGKAWQIGKVAVHFENCSAEVRKVPLGDTVQIANWGKTINRLDVTAQSGSTGECRVVFQL